MSSEISFLYGEIRELAIVDSTKNRDRERISIALAIRSLDPATYQS